MCSLSSLALWCSIYQCVRSVSPSPSVSLLTYLQMYLSLSIHFSVRIGTETHWQYLLLLNIVPCTLCLVVLPCLPDSPRYLMIVKKDRKAAEKGTPKFSTRQSGCVFTCPCTYLAVYVYLQLFFYPLGKYCKVLGDVYILNLTCSSS